MGFSELVETHTGVLLDPEQEQGSDTRRDVKASCSVRPTHVL